MYTNLKFECRYIWTYNIKRNHLKYLNITIAILPFYPKKQNKTKQRNKNKNKNKKKTPTELVNLKCATYAAPICVPLKISLIMPLPMYFFTLISCVIFPGMLITDVNTI